MYEYFRGLEGEQDVLPDMRLANVPLKLMYFYVKNFFIIFLERLASTGKNGTVHRTGPPGQSHPETSPIAIKKDE